MKLTRIAASSLLVAMVVAPMPAWAVFCTSEGPLAPQTFEDDDGGSRLVTDTKAQAAMDQRRLKEIGVVASSVERWNGCLRAFITRPDGSNGMEFYDPGTLRRVQ